MSAEAAIGFVVSLARELSDDDWMEFLTAVFSENTERAIKRMVEGGRTEAEARELIDAQQEASGEAFDRFWDEQRAVARAVEHKHKTRRRLRLVPKDQPA